MSAPGCTLAPLTPKCVTLARASTPLSPVAFALFRVSPHVLCAYDGSLMYVVSDRLILLTARVGCRPPLMFTHVLMTQTLPLYYWPSRCPHTSSSTRLVCVALARVCRGMGAQFGAPQFPELSMCGRGRRNVCVAADALTASFAVDRRHLRALRHAQALEKGSGARRPRAR